MSIHGSTRRISDEVERALLEYMMRGSYRISADESGKILGVKEVRFDIKVPEDLEKKILKSRQTSRNSYKVGKYYLHN